MTKSLIVLIAVVVVGMISSLVLFPHYVESTVNEGRSIDVYVKGILYLQSAYDPVINPADFTTEITNPYVSLPVGKKIVFNADTEDGIEQIKILVTSETKTIMGVETIVYWDRVWIDDQLLEDTRDWLAQDREGNVWYFGEEVDNYEDGVLVNHAGSWEAGVDGAQPGIWMIANPQVGDLYRQEFYAGEAEDLALVMSLDESVSVEFGKFSDCLKTRNWTPLEPNVYEWKYYCPQVGNMVLEEKPDEKETVELIDVQHN